MRYKNYYYEHHGAWGWYLMTPDKSKYILNDGSMYSRCGTNGYWLTEEEVKDFIDSMMEFFGMEDFKL